MEGNSSEVEEGNFSQSDTGADFSTLPEACIVYILALTSPRDVCRMWAVAPWLLPALESDALWLRFLPDDYLQILARSAESPSLRDFSKKELFFRLCDSPVLIDEGKKSFWLEKSSGKKCYMLAARELAIAWGDTPRYWAWPSVPESRFSEVAFLKAVCWFEVRSKIDTHALSSRTKYAAYLVFGRRDSYGFEGVKVKSSFGIVGGETTSENIIYLDEGTRGAFDGRYPEMRKDDTWLEIELGEFFNEGGENIELDITIIHFDGGWKRGLIIEGIEIRPKDDL